MIGVQTLAGKQIVVAVTGSIAAVEVVKLIHSLRRCGAVVQPIMSHAATGIIQPDALTYASGRETITRLSGWVEHITYCGEEGSADLLLIAPCTANTISKIACGIDDTPANSGCTRHGCATPAPNNPAPRYDWGTGCNSGLLSRSRHHMGHLLPFQTEPQEIRR